MAALLSCFGWLGKLVFRPWTAFALSATCAFVLSPLPEWLGLSFLRLDGIRHDVGGWIGLVCVGTFFIGLAAVGKGYRDQRAVRGKATERQRRRAERAERAAKYAQAKREQDESVALARLDTLNEWEANLLLAGVTTKSQTVSCVRDYPQGQTLVAKGLLLAVPRAKDALSETFIIPDFVWVHINRPKILKQINKKIRSPITAQQLNSLAEVAGKLAGGK